MLTEAQLTSLRAACLASPTAAAFFSQAEGSAAALKAHLNSASSFIVWRTRVTQDEIMMNGFDWVQVDNLSVGKARIWEWMFSNSEHAINPTKANVRAGIAECWKGTQAMLNVQAAVLGHCRRAATVGERMLATGTGTTETPGLMAFEGEISDSEAARLIFKDDGSIWTA